MSAVIDRDLQSFFSSWSGMRHDRRASILQIARKMDCGSLGVERVNEMIERIRCGSVTFDDGLAALAATH